MTRSMANTKAKSRWKPVELPLPNNNINQSKWHDLGGISEINSMNKVLKDVVWWSYHILIQLVYLACAENRWDLENYSVLL